MVVVVGADMFLAGKMCSSSLFISKKVKLFFIFFFSFLHSF